MEMAVKEGDQARRARAQFREIGEWLKRGWRKLPAGACCPECKGPCWAKQSGRVERWRCSYCGWTAEYTVR